MDTSGVMGVHNCSVAFFSQCMSIAKCKTSCKSMGAAKYRWFHESGCCQCIGSTCFDYGLNEPHCLQCPLGAKAEEENEVSEEWSPEYEENKIDRQAGKAKMGEDDEVARPAPDVVPGSL